MAVTECVQSDIEMIRRRGQTVERGTTEYQILHEELKKLGENIEAYGCMASEDSYRDLVNLLPEDERKKYIDMLETHKD